MRECAGEAGENIRSRAHAHRGAAVFVGGFFFGSFSQASLHLFVPGRWPRSVNFTTERLIRITRRCLVVSDRSSAVVGELRSGGHMRPAELEEL